jgi:hypothetical protein
LNFVTFGNEDPIENATLFLVSGEGDPEIPYTTFTKVTINDAMIAFGFRNLEVNHTYNVGELKVDFEVITPVELENWQLFYPNVENPTITLANSGPLESETIDILASQNVDARKMFTNASITQTSVIGPHYVGRTTVNVTDVTGFAVGGFIDILQGNAANIGREILEINGNEITFSPALDFSINSGESGQGGIVQTSLYNKTINIDGTTANLLVRDRNVNREVIFYIQNFEGYFMEWDFKAFQEWVSYNIFFFGETARLPMSFFEKDGTPFPDGTQVDLSVDMKPDVFAADEVESASVTRTSFAGQNRIYVSSTEGYARGQTIDILDKNGNIQIVEIVEVGEDEFGPYVEIAEPLEFDVSFENGTTIRVNTTTEEKLTPTNNLLATEVPVVDVTPVVNDKDVDPSLLKPYDIERVPPSTPYEDLNTAQEFFQKEVIDMPTVDGNCCVRVLPIVEDILETVAEKEEDLSRLQRYSIDTDIVAQLEQAEGDQETATELPTVEEETDQGEQVDYIIETPVFTRDGIAVSSMQSFATDYTATTFSELNIPGIPNPQYFSKDYEIYASADFLGETGRTLARLYLDPFDVSFITPIVMDSTYVEEAEHQGADEFGVQYYAQDPNAEGCTIPYGRIKVRGHYASDGEKITIDYVVSEKFILVNNKTLNVTLYSNRVADLEAIAAGVVYGVSCGLDCVKKTPVKEQFANIRPLRNINQATDTEGATNNTQTPIDTWREIVANNPFEEVIDSVDQTDDSPTVESQATSISDDIINTYAEAIGGEVASDESAGSEGVFYTDPFNWTLAKQYEQYEFSIPIVNGRARLEIPTSDIVHLLFVEAKVPFGEQDEHEQVLADLVFVANPVTISGVNPGSISPVENELYEIGASIQFLDGEIPIEDNVQVNFSFGGGGEQTTSDFKVEPSSSVTDNGWAGGVFIGPIEPIEPQPINPNDDSLCPPKISISATVEVFHPSGYVRKATRTIDLVGTTLDEEDDTFLFYAQDATRAVYADGSIDPDAKITINLNDDLNPTLIFVGEENIPKLLGEDQPNGPRVMTAFNSTPRRQRWFTDRLEITALPRNKNIGHPKPLGENQFFLEPWSSQVNAYTSYRRENGGFARGEIASGLPIPTLLGGIRIPKPVQMYKEPLGIEMKYETNYARDGLTSARIYAEVTWKGEPIINQVTIGDGTDFESVIDFPLPKVTFRAGTCEEENITEGDLPSAIDDRNLSSGCLTIAPSTDFTLSDYSVQAGLFRSDIHTETDSNGDIVSVHTHVTEIDQDGNGTTTQTIDLFGTIADHTHTYTNYQSDTALDHSHGVRCVAFTNILPTENVDTNFAVNGYVIYDPTNCEPYSGPNNPEGNRMMFATLRSDLTGSGSELARRLSSRIEIGPDLDNGDPIFVLDYEGEGEEGEEGGEGPAGSEETSVTFYTATSIDETERGFDVRVFVKFPEYSYFDDIGNEIIVPEEFVVDGSRVTMEITAFKPEEKEGQSDPGFLVMGSGIKRDYMNLKCNVSVTSDDFISERKFTIAIASIQQWYPKIRHEVPELTSDDIYLDTAINNFGFFGSSQIHDAVKKAAENLVQSQTDDETFKDYKKFIVLISDGDENTSESSLNQAIRAVDFVDGDGEVQIIPIQLGQPHASDSVLLEKYAEGGGTPRVFYLDYSTPEQINKVCESVVSGNNLQINTTTLTGEVVFESPNIPSATVLDGVTVPEGGEVTYRVRTSVDGITFGDWSPFIDHAIPFEYDVSLESLQQVVQYEIKLIGNSNFESPTVQEVEVSYYDPREFVIFFKPISVNLQDDEYISSIHITTEADIPDNSTVEFLMTQSNSLRPEEYYDIVPDQHTILPTRFNEILLTNDFKTFRAINGRWNVNSEIEIYRLAKDNTQGIIIPPSEYSANPNEGTVTFLSSQDPSTIIFMNVFFASSFRIATKVTNFASESATIHHIGVMYNISKRIPRSSDGTIIHVPISKRLPE